MFMNQPTDRGLCNSHHLYSNMVGMTCLLKCLLDTGQVKKDRGIIQLPLAL